MPDHSTRLLAFATAAVVAGLSFAACAGDTVSEGPPAVATAPSFAAHDPNSAAHDAKVFIGGWYDGEAVRLRYTRPYFCDGAVVSGAPSGCVVGAAPAEAPREGSIPPIYAIAAVGIQPDPATIHCPRQCMHHPSTIDLSRIGGPRSAMAVPHSHIVTSRQAGWHQTVNIRVRSLAVWNEIAAAKSLERVRELQADPAVGGAGLISQDTPTNIFFFVEVHKQGP